MRQAILVERDGSEPEPRALAAHASAGGSRSDTIPLSGAPPCALRLEPCAAGVVVEAAAAGVRAAGRALAPGSRRLVRAGERVELHGAAIALPAPDDGTRAVAGALLRDAAEGALAAGPRLVVLTGRDAGLRHPLASDQVLGRGRSAQVRVVDAQASRRHARLRLGPAGARVEDLRSKNGVFVNGVRIERRRARALQPGDEVRIGETELAFEDPWAGGEASRAARPEEPARPRSRGPRARALAAALLAASAAALALAGS
jgi:FHA domain